MCFTICLVSAACAKAISSCKVHMDDCFDCISKVIISEAIESFVFLIPRQISSPCFLFFFILELIEFETWFPTIMSFIQLEQTKYHYLYWNLCLLVRILFWSWNTLFYKCIFYNNIKYSVWGMMSFLVRAALR